MAKQAHLLAIFAKQAELMLQFNASIMTTYLTFFDQFVIKGVL